MLPKNIKFPLLLLFLAGLGSVLAFRVWQVKKAKSIPFSLRLSSFKLEPPSKALKGKLISVEGKVEKEPREKDKFEEVSVGEEILQGEKLAIGESSQATIEFPDFAKISLTSKSEIDFISLLPSNFLIHQPSGSVSYKLLQDKEPLSVRSLHALLTFSSGESQVILKEEEITVKILAGQAKLALVDLENKTNVWQLKEGQKALIDDTERTVEIKKL